VYRLTVVLFTGTRTRLPLNDILHAVPHAISTSELFPFRPSFLRIVNDDTGDAVQLDKHDVKLKSDNPDEDDQQVEGLDDDFFETDNK